jgi:hypothetical protein
MKAVRSHSRPTDSERNRLRFYKRKRFRKRLVQQLNQESCRSASSKSLEPVCDEHIFVNAYVSANGFGYVFGNL